MSHLVQDAKMSLQMLSSLWDEIGQELEQRNNVAREIENEIKRIFNSKIQDAQETKAQMHLRIRVSGVRIKTLRSQLGLDRKDSVEPEDLEGLVATIPLRLSLNQLEHTLQKLDESKSIRITTLKGKSDYLAHLIQDLEEPMDRELQEILHIDLDGDLSTRREGQLDHRIAELECKKSERKLHITALCDRMKQIWESLGVVFLESDTDALDVKVS